MEPSSSDGHPAFTTKVKGVADALRRDILNGVFPRGTQLHQEQVAARFGVSPTPVREAFGILETEGFIERRPHHGAFVVGKQYDDIEDAYRARGALEIIAAGRAASRRDPEAIQRLEAAHEAGRLALDGDDLTALRQANHEFHIRLFEAAGSKTLHSLFSQLMAGSLLWVPVSGEHASRRHEEHRAILSAIANGAVEDAKTLLEQHMEDGLEILVAQHEVALSEIPNPQ